MIDIRVVREHPEIVKDTINRKFQEAKLPLVDKILELDKQWRALKTEGDSLRAERNKVSKEVNDAKKAGKDASALLKRAKKIPEMIEESEKEAGSVENKIEELMLQIPNIMSKETPLGKGAEDNKVIKKEGDIPKFDFPVKTHVELAESLGIADFEASARVSGNGFYYLKGDLGLLNQALIRFTMDYMESKGYLYIEPPLMLNGKSIFASADKTAIAQSVYDIAGEDLHLIGTSEQSILAMHTGQAMPENELPKKYYAYSMCFRKEVGAHGINEKGLWRTHQFNKVEQFVFCKPEDTEKLYSELLKNSEDILKKLKLPYQVVEICSGDLSDWKYRSADIEVWRPTTKSYGEIISLSNCSDYQARKLGIKYIDKANERKIVHTLNNTAMATSRIMVAILENHQQKDGTIKIPAVLVPYMNGKKVIGAPLKENKIGGEVKKPQGVFLKRK